MNTDRVKEGFSLLQEGMKILQHGPLDYYVRRLTGAYEFLLTLAPHKVGDHVRLMRTPEISDKKAWGWICGKHFLIEGAEAVVKGVEADSEGFSYDLTFEDDSWIDSDKVEHPREPEDRGVFRFRQDWIGPWSSPMSTSVRR